MPARRRKRKRRTKRDSPLVVAYVRGLPVFRGWRPERGPAEPSTDSEPKA